ncbi:MAG: hypothetical protein GY743_23045 [Planctomycetaceae bacterium]|nr:hypothetical protein [Planctomycetaceae bacterium]MCP4951829.1 hypothetical protein [Pseudomonadota bacterium]
MKKAPTLAQIKARIAKLRRPLHVPYTFNKKRPSGAAHFYYKLNDSWGIKFRIPTSYDEGNNHGLRGIVGCWRRQKEGHRNGIAPPVGELVVITHMGTKYYGYVTAHVFTFEGWDLPDHPTPKQREYAIMYRTHQRRVCAKIKEVFGIGVQDAKFGNFGMYNGELVAVDWGCEGFGYNRDYIDGRMFPEVAVRG